MASCFTITDKIDGMKCKLNVWKSCVSKNCIDMIHKMSATITVTGSKHEKFALRDKISEHLTVHLERFEMYFPSEEDPQKHNGWIGNFF